MAIMTPEQRCILGLWMTLQVIQDNGHAKDQPLPTLFLDEDDHKVLGAALDANAVEAEALRTTGATNAAESGLSERNPTEWLHP